jgi:hypothetical protein
MRDFLTQPLALSTIGLGVLDGPIRNLIVGGPIDCGGCSDTILELRVKLKSTLQNRLGR